MTPEAVHAYVCTWREAENIGPCLAAIRAAGVQRVFVVDAGSDDGTAQRARQAGAEVLAAPRGLAGQRQAAIDHCRADLLLFVDADDRLHPDCVRRLLADMAGHDCDVVQASNRVLSPRRYLERGMDAVMALVTSRPGPTAMVGRPALYRIGPLRQAGMDLEFNGVGNEDAALAIRLEGLGARQRIGTGLSFRRHPAGWGDNIRAWRKYGHGDAALFRRYPDKRRNVLRHLLYVYPVERSRLLWAAGQGRLAGYTVLVGAARFLFMLEGLLRRRPPAVSLRPAAGVSPERSGNGTG